MSQLNPIPEEGGTEQRQNDVESEQGSVEQVQNGIEQVQGGMELGQLPHDEETRTAGVSDLPNKTPDDIVPDTEATQSSGTTEGEGERGEEGEGVEEKGEGEKEANMEISEVPQIEVVCEEREGGSEEAGVEETKRTTGPTDEQENVCDMRTH